MGYKTKQGDWVKEGNCGAVSWKPGSYCNYEYHRAAPSKYPKTEQQKKIGACARKKVKEGMKLKDIHNAIRKCWGKEVPE